MIDVNEVKEFVDFLANKEQSGNSVSPSEFNLNLRRATDDLFRKEYGLPEDYKPGVPLPDISYEITQRIKDDMRVFKKTETITIDANGNGNIPDDYVHYTGIRYNKVTNNTGGQPTVEPKSVEAIDDDKWVGRIGNSIKVPNKDYPICNFNSSSIQFEPKDLYKVDLTYLKYPSTPNWAYTITDGTAIYDAGNSTNIELPKMLTNDLVRLICSYYGIRFRDNALTQYAEMIKTKGV